jgi:hypothetical protein
MTPLYSDDLTEVSEVSNDVLVLLRSSDSAEHAPDYREVARISLR